MKQITNKNSNSFSNSNNFWSIIINPRAKLSHDLPFKLEHTLKRTSEVAPGILRQMRLKVWCGRRAAVNRNWQFWPFCRRKEVDRLIREKKQKAVSCNEILAALWLGGDKLYGIVAFITCPMAKANDAKFVAVSLAEITVSVSNFVKLNKRDKGWWPRE